MTASRTRTGPSPAVVAIACERSIGACEVGGEGLEGERGVDWSVHHRRPRQMGGTSRPESNQAANLLIVCGSGTTGCHGHIESHRERAYEMGWLVRSGNEPTGTLILHARFGWCFLTDEGGFRVADLDELGGKVEELAGVPRRQLVDLGVLVEVFDDEDEGDLNGPYGSDFWGGA